MPDGWLASAIAAFNHPNEMGERVEDAVVELEELAAAVPADATPEQRDALAVLRAEADASVGARGDGPYVAARLRKGRLELFHCSRRRWIPRAELDAQRAHTVARRPSAGAELWAGFDPHGPEIEERFERYSGDRRLVDVARELCEEGAHDLVEEIATAALREGAIHPGHWWNLLGEVRLARLDLPGARAAIAHSVMYVSTYDPLAFALMVRWLEESGADAETVGIVYHAVTGWSHHLSEKRFLGRRRIPKPTSLKTKFGPIYAAWVREVWRGVEGFGPDHLLHLRSLFGDLAARPLADLRKEVDAAIEVMLNRR